MKHYYFSVESLIWTVFFVWPFVVYYYYTVYTEIIHSLQIPVMFLMIFACILWLLQGIKLINLIKS